MRISQAGLDLIKRFEGLSLTAYKDVAGVPTIGYGTTRYPNGSMVRLGDKCTEAQAGEYLREAVIGCEEAVSQYIGVPLSQAQFDALVSLVYNVGAGAFSESTLRRKLNAADYRGAAVEFDRWVYAGGRKIEGLIKRRRAERELFESGLDVPQSGAPVPGAGTPPVAETATYLAGEAAYSAPLKQEPTLLKIPPWPFNNPPSEARMFPPFIAAALPALVQMAPDLIRIIGKGEQSERNAQAAEKVAEIARTVSGQPTIEGAVGALQASPELKAKYQEAIRQQWLDLMDMAERIQKADQESIKEARTFNASEPFLLDTAWVKLRFVHLLSLIMVGFSGWFAIGHWADLTAELRGAIITLMVIAGWNGVRDYWMGSSEGSNRKTEMLQRER